MSVVSGIMGANAQSDAADSASASNTKTLDAQQDMYNQDVARQEPFYQTGLAALPEFERMLGINQTPKLSAEDQRVIDDYDNWQATGQQETSQRYSADRYVDDTTSVGGEVSGKTLVRGEALNPEGEWWGNQTALDRAREAQTAVNNYVPSENAGDAPELSPLAQWELQQGNQALGRSEAARGLSGSGGAARRQGDMEMGVAARDYTDSYNRILDALQLGTGASASMGNSSAAQSANIGTAGTNAQNIAIGQGNAQAQLYSGISGNTMQGVGVGLEVYDRYGGGGAPAGYDPVGPTNAEGIF